MSKSLLGILGINLLIPSPKNFSYHHFSQFNHRLTIFRDQNLTLLCYLEIIENHNIREVKQSLLDDDTERRLPA